MDTAAVFYCHELSDRTAEALKALLDSAAIPVFVMFDDRMKKNDRRKLDALGVPAHPFRAERWTDYKRRGRLKNFIPGNTETSFLQFREAEPGFSYYWFIEYDVRFTGAWSTLFTAWRESDADLLATSVASPREAPDWPLWHTAEHPDRSFERDDLVRAFLPACRLSGRGLDVITQEYASGLTGHSELTVPTALRLNGLAIEDIGGEGPWVAAGNENRFYTSNLGNNSLSPGSFVFRPPMAAPGDIQDFLWHPVKSIEPWNKRKRKVGLRRFLGL